MLCVCPFSTSCYPVSDHHTAADRRDAGRPAVAPQAQTQEAGAAWRRGRRRRRQPRGPEEAEGQRRWCQATQGTCSLSFAPGHQCDRLVRTCARLASAGCLLSNGASRGNRCTGSAACGGKCTNSVSAVQVMRMADGQLVSGAAGESTPRIWGLVR